MLQGIIIGIIALAALKGRKQKGVGSVKNLHGEKRKPRKKRTIFMEIADAQKAGIDFNEPYNPQQSAILNRLAERYNFNKALTTRKDGSWYDNAEQYFDTLRRTLKAISGVGATDLPYQQSEVKNGNGDVVIIYRDYGTPEQQLQDAIAYIEELPLTDERAAKLRTLAYIAGGGKLVWKNKKIGGQLIGRGVEDILHSSEGERRERISYLGTPAKGALTLDQLAHRLWESSGMETDDGVIYDGVELAVLNCTSRKQALEEVMLFYRDAHIIPDMPEYDTPF